MKYFNILIAITILDMLAGGAGAVEPPPAVLKIGENEQTSGIGSYCWEEAGKGVCADMIGIITAKEPLPASSHFTAHFSLPLQEPPQELQLNIIRVTDDDEIKRVPNSFRAWHAREGNYFKLPLERESDINLSLEPGLYVLNVFARWKEKGDVTYGFLIEVRDSGAGTITLTVDKSGGANYTKIQDAINNASNGDTILVNSGTYYENVNVTKRLVLKGVDTGRSEPVVNASGNGSAITLSTGWSTLEGFIVVNAEKPPETTTEKSAVVVREPNYGIRVISNNNMIRNNTASNSYYGISLEYSSNNTLVNNTAFNSNFGISLAYSNNNTLGGNNASKNEEGIHLFISAKNTLSGNQASKNNFGIFLSSSINNMLNGNIANLNNNWGITIWDSSYNILSHNEVYRNQNGIHLYTSNNNTLYGNSANVVNNYSISLDTSSNNIIYNNVFSSFTITNSVNRWNTTKTKATPTDFSLLNHTARNIVEGYYLGGNLWENFNGKYFSERKCEDGDDDGICDSPYALERGNIDYLPLISYPDDKVPAEKTPGFQAVLAITTLSVAYVAYVFAWKRR